MGVFQLFLGEQVSRYQHGGQQAFPVTAGHDPLQAIVKLPQGMNGDGHVEMPACP